MHSEISPPSILVVDDETDNFDTVDLLLAQDNYQLFYAANGLDALAHLEEHQPDLILMDVRMSKMGGIETCCQIKANTLWRHIPIIMITALASKSEMAACLEAGADDFIAKPVHGIELRARVRSMLRVRKQYLALQESLQLRTDLAHMIVHDLRSPLAAIMLSCDLIQRWDEIPERQMRSVERISAAGRQLQSLIDSLLTIAKLEAGKLTLQRQFIDLRVIGQQVVQDFEAIAKQKRLQIHSHFPDIQTDFPVDSAVFRRVLDNLMSNAIKFSPLGGQIQLSISYPDLEQAIIQVIDQGKGISDELKQSIFEKFEVGELTTKIPQTGLGLAFCKMAVLAHGGTLDVMDNIPKGSIFSVSLFKNPTDTSN